MIRVCVPVESLQSACSTLRDFTLQDVKYFDPVSHFFVINTRKCQLKHEFGGLFHVH